MGRDALGRPDADLAEVVGALIDTEHVPFLAAYRYKPSGLRKRAEWERTWELQRREDAIAARLGSATTSPTPRCGRRSRTRSVSTAPERVLRLVDDAYLATLARAVTGGLGGKVGVAPWLYLRKLVGDVLDRTWRQWWHGLAPMTADGRSILEHLIGEGFLETDGGLAFIGPEAERRFGRRHFSELMAVFTAAPEFVVLAGRDEIGSVGDDVLLADTEGAPRVLLLAGRTWKVTHIDWKRRRCFVEPTDLPGRARWGGFGGGLSFEITRGMRDVLLGETPTGVRFSRRATRALGDLREHHSGHVAGHGTVIRCSADGDLHWWTWAGTSANRTLQASLGDLVDPRQRIGDEVLRLRHGDDPRWVAAALDAVDPGEITAPPWIPAVSPA